MLPKTSVGILKSPLSEVKDTLVSYAFEKEFLHNKGIKDCLTTEQLLIIQEEGFSGKLREVRTLPGKAGLKRFILTGLGERSATTIESARRATGYAIQEASRLKAKTVVLDLSEFSHLQRLDVIEACAESALLSCHRVKDCKPEDKNLPPEQILLSIGPQTPVDELALARGIIAGEHTLRARELINTSPSIATPEFIVRRAAEEGKGKVDVTIFREEELKQKNMGGIIAVGKGSRHPPRLLILEYKHPAAKKKVCLVGKGVTFDSGGLSLKPSASMETMKADKSGAVAVVECTLAAQRMDLPIHLYGICAFAENMPGEDAFKLGDIVQAASGKTIEILNTDAEGRVVLADALHYATQLQPDAIVDIATLTGACSIALGNGIAGIMGNDPALIAQLRKAGEDSVEKLWELPLEPDYADFMKSQFADLKNIQGGGKTAAGSITAGFFLKEFVGNAKWAHIDMAGPAWNAEENLKGYLSLGGTGFGVRLFLRYLRNLVQ